MNALPPSVESFEDLLALFHYDRAVSADVREGEVEVRDGVEMRDLSQSALDIGWDRAHLVTPAPDGPAPAIVFVHSMPGTRFTSRNEAIELARDGAASFLANTYWSRRWVWSRTRGDPKIDIRSLIAQVVALRRSIDYLATRPDIDAGRIAFVGHGLGAMVGGVLAGVEKRIRALVLMAGSGRFVDTVDPDLPEMEGIALEHYAQAMAPIDPVYYVGHAAPAPLFFQLGERDGFFPREKQAAFAEAGSEPKTVRWYDADHSLNTQAREERHAWLRGQLGLTET
jgi:uncharacterized protein